MRLQLAAIALGLLLPLAASAEARIAAAWLLERDGVVDSEHHADTHLPAASLGKLMTAVLWLQQPGRLEQTLSISKRAASATGARAGLGQGERYLGRDLLSAMLVRSANDACIALAESASPSVESFVRDMNRAVEVLKLSDTRFVNPCGWDADGQYSSARDLLKLAQLAMEYPEISAAVARREFLLESTDGKQSRLLHNTNLLLGNLDGVRGVKTGFTAKAGKCLIALAERGPHQVWLVLLGAPERWWTAHAMIDEALGAGLTH
ncbi:MAG: D-alanyl-D-alanine carboxypeptidase [Gammaproteobacteria bacterium]|nr:D-alanyl-D-alanine carboxypeptidase [Gammaproteobacteria bacterium]